MTITIEIIGNDEDINKYFGSKVYSKTFREKAAKQLSKQNKKDFDFLNAKAESGICTNETKFTLTFAHYGPCKAPIKKHKKNGKTSK